MKKLTLISLTVYGKRYSLFVYVTTLPNGKCVVDIGQIKAILGINLPRGTTFSIG